mmetsp:Transcript_58389/g.88037  ORF Transcript_58389/g.88037 Transcript_58389/m.88037 type:complete len:81 (+) Transcript_58389:317-559(+)
MGFCESRDFHVSGVQRSAQSSRYSHFVCEIRQNGLLVRIATPNDVFGRQSAVHGLLDETGHEKLEFQPETISKNDDQRAL